MYTASCAPRATGWSLPSLPVESTPWPWPALASGTVFLRGHHLYVDDLSTAADAGARVMPGCCWTGSSTRRKGSGAASCISTPGAARSASTRTGSTTTTGSRSTRTTSLAGCSRVRLLTGRAHAVYRRTPAIPRRPFRHHRCADGSSASVRLSTGADSRERRRQPPRRIRSRPVVHVDLRRGEVGVPHPLLQLARIGCADRDAAERVAQVVEAQRTQPGRVASALEAPAQRRAVQVARRPARRTRDRPARVQRSRSPSRASACATSSTRGTARPSPDFGVPSFPAV